MDPSKIAEYLANRNIDTGQRIADLPRIQSTFRESLFGNDAVTNALREQENNKIMELFNHDKQVAEKYRNNPPATQPAFKTEYREYPAQVLDPYLREIELSQRYGSTLKDLGGIRKNISTRRDVLGDELTNFMDLLKTGIEASKAREAAKQQEFENILNLVKETGGNVTYGGKTYSMPKKQTQADDVIELQKIFGTGITPIQENLMPSNNKVPFQGNPPQMSAPYGTIVGEWFSAGRDGWVPIVD